MAGGYGNYIVVRHDPHTETLYGHLGETAVASGQRITRGQRLGIVGSSGLSTGLHLHFEVRRDGRPVDPGPWLAAHSTGPHTEVTTHGQQGDPDRPADG
jgi:murein DD-endopeptidase MepM/ murein hydrolase activator NlpD